VALAAPGQAAVRPHRRRTAAPARAIDVVHALDAVRVDYAPDAEAGHAGARRTTDA
jgi:hypothetical protein